MAVATIIGAAVAAVGAIVGGIINASSRNKAQRESRELMELQLDMRAQEIRNKNIRQRQTDLFQQQQIETQQAGVAEEKQFRERERSSRLNRQQIGDTLAMINQSNQMRTQFQSTFDDRKFR